MNAPAQAGGQASLEYLLVVAAFLSVLLLVAPLIQNAYSAALFAVDSRNAQAFMHRLESLCSALSVLGSGSAEVLHAEPIGRWHITASGGLLELEVESAAAGKAKKFSITSPLPFSGASAAIERHSLVKISRSGNSISLSISEVQ